MKGFVNASEKDPLNLFIYVKLGIYCCIWFQYPLSPMRTYRVDFACSSICKSNFINNLKLTHFFNLFS